jgi:signal transduction histidine kinase
MPMDPTPLSRPEFEEFLLAFAHELRNRLNAIGLEAADLAEQVGGAADATRLQSQVRECAAFLRTTREMLIPDDPAAERLSLPDVVAQMQKKR